MDRPNGSPPPRAPTPPGAGRWPTNPSIKPAELTSTLPSLHKILILEDDADFRQVLRRMLAPAQDNIEEFDSVEALEKSGSVGEASVLLLDLNLGGKSGMSLIADLVHSNPLLQIIVITGNPAVDTAVEAIRLGALNYLVKPVSRGSLHHAIEKALELRGEKARKLAEQIGLGYAPRPTPRILGDSPAICAVNLLVERYAPVGTAPVLITGESGVGKELVAEAIHRRSPRAQQPFVKINCATIPRPLAESDLFGHERGAFTDAKEAKKGIFELAEGGTVLLDEIGELDMEIQPKLLRVLEEKIVVPLGAERGRRVDVRVIAATNRDLYKHCQAGHFREDLFFRLAVLSLNVPPLRRRKQDIPILAEYMLKEKMREVGRSFVGFSDDVLRFFEAYDWPGNVRELRNMVERLVILSEGPLIDLSEETLATFRFQPQRSQSSSGLSALQAHPPPTATPDADITPDEATGPSEPVKTLAELEKCHIRRALQLSDNNRSRCARMLGIARSTLLAKIKDYGLDSSTG